jgi:hypothetical protein
MLKFKNADVAAKYKSSFKGDPAVHLPGKNATGFSIPHLSDITLEQAEKLINSPNQNLIEMIEPVTATPAKRNEKPGTDKSPAST